MGANKSKSTQADESEQERAQQTISNILHNYRQQEESMVKQLYFAHDKHGTTIGTFREDIWQGMFEQMLPKKFAIAQSVFIIDSYGQVSREVDLAIFDETYTPYIFRVGRLKFLPIEAVAVVVECKSTSLTKDTLTTWAECIAALQTSRVSCARMYSHIAVVKKEAPAVQDRPGKPKPTQTATRPLRILCCLDTFQNEVLPGHGNEQIFDIVIRASKRKNRLCIHMDKQNLQSWYLALNHVGYEKKKENEYVGADGTGICSGTEINDLTLANYAVGDNDISLLTLNLQLNQILMLVNNPMPFPHQSYAEMFCQNAKEGEA